MEVTNESIAKLTQKIKALEMQKRAQQKKQREEQRKTDSRRFYIIGELVVKFFPELNEIKPGTKAQNAENFNGCIKFLETISADEKIADFFQDCIQDKPENSGNV